MMYVLIPLCLCLAAVLDVISRFHVRLVVVAGLLQALDVRTFVGIFSLCVLFAVDQSGVDPAMHHLVHAVVGAGCIVAGRKRVNEAAICHGQCHISRPGLDLAHAHIAAGLGQVDVALCAGPVRWR